jgi:hypothetical protein
MIPTPARRFESSRTIHPPPRYQDRLFKTHKIQASPRSHILSTQQPPMGIGSLPFAIDPLQCAFLIHSRLGVDFLLPLPKKLLMPPPLEPLLALGVLKLPMCLARLPPALPVETTARSVTRQCHSSVNSVSLQYRCLALGVLKLPMCLARLPPALPVEATARTKKAVSRQSHFCSDPSVSHQCQFSVIPEQVLGQAPARLATPRDPAVMGLGCDPSSK